ncbi:recombinase, partial [Clostridium sp. MCC345]|nr:recombinase [Clostridium sp. MCC345]
MSVARKTLIFQCFQKYRYLTSAFQRPGFQAMLADIEAGKVGTVIVKDMSRLGRN